MGHDEGNRTELAGLQASLAALRPLTRENFGPGGPSDVSPLTRAWQDTASPLCRIKSASFKLFLMKNESVIAANQEELDSGMKRIVVVESELYSEAIQNSVANFAALLDGPKSLSSPLSNEEFNEFNAAVMHKRNSWLDALAKSATNGVQRLKVLRCIKPRKSWPDIDRARRRGGEKSHPACKARSTFGRDMVVAMSHYFPNAPDTLWR